MLPFSSMGRPDVLVVDLDGTLLDRHGELSHENVSALERAAQAGLPIIVATGRTANECRHVLDQLHGPGAIIGASGSLLSDVTTRRTIDRRVIAPDVVANVLQACEFEGAAIMLLKDSHATGVDYVIVGTGELHPVSDWWFEHTGATYHRVACLEDDPHPDHTVRIGAVGTPDQFDPMVDGLHMALGDAILARHWEAVTSSARAGQRIHLLEVFHPKADKWTMLESWCRLEGIELHRTAAVGDGLNDVMLIERCALGVAMANADHRVLAVADAVTGDHEDHGVATLIDDLLAGRLDLGSGRSRP